MTHISLKWKLILNIQFYTSVFYFAFKLQSVRNLKILTRIHLAGIYNYDEYSLIGDKTDLSPTDKTLSMKRTPTQNKDQEKLDKLKKKYRTEDGCKWFVICMNVHLLAERNWLYQVNKMTRCSVNAVVFNWQYHLWRIRF